MKPDLDDQIREPLVNYVRDVIRNGKVYYPEAQFTIWPSSPEFDEVRAAFYRAMMHVLDGDVELDRLAGQFLARVVIRKTQRQRALLAARGAVQASLESFNHTPRTQNQLKVSGAAAFELGAIEAPLEVERQLVTVSGRPRNLFPGCVLAAQHFEQQVRQFVLSRVRDAEAQAAFDAVMTAPIEDAGDPIVTVETVAD